jgi:peroxiredoxin
MTANTTQRRPSRRPGALAALQQQQARAERTKRLLIMLGITAAIVAVIAAMMLNSRPRTSTATRVAPDFTLTDTAGGQIHLADFRGQNVVLYFSEGAGCGSCIEQMGAIERDSAAFADAGVVVLPIVMNSRSDIIRDMQTYRVRTPFLLDDGTVSREYKTLGRGMHQGLPGHSFVLIDSSGVQRWYGEYPSMWLSPSDLLKQVRSHLPA